MIRSILAVILLTLILSSLLSSQEKRLAAKDWKLVWQDEFNGKTLDAKKWNVLLREQSKHNELQYYLPDEVYVERGLRSPKPGEVVKVTEAVLTYVAVDEKRQKRPVPPE